MSFKEKNLREPCLPHGKLRVYHAVSMTLRGEKKVVSGETVMTILTNLIPEDWYNVLEDEFKLAYWKELEIHISKEMEKDVVFPPLEEIFSAFDLTPYSKVNVLLLGQDPYHDHGQAHGLCFSVRNGFKLPPSLKNIYKELYDDLGIPVSCTGCLVPWAEQGVLMLNSTLTVRAHQAASHSKSGWKNFTDAVIKAVNNKKSSVIFVLWGRHAASKERLIDTSSILLSSHLTHLRFLHIVGFSAAVLSPKSIMLL